MLLILLLTFAQAPKFDGQLSVQPCIVRDAWLMYWVFVQHLHVDAWYRNLPL